MSKSINNARAGMLAGLTAGHEQAAIDRRLAADMDRGRAVALLDQAAILSRAADTRPARAEHVLALAESVAAVGLLQPLAVDRAGRLVAGLHRLECCRLLLTPPKERAARIGALDGAVHLDVKETAARLRALPAPDALAEPLLGGKIPCRVLDLDAERDPSAALAAETAENTARRQYTSGEVSALVERLRAAGYVEREGRPQKGGKALRPALELVLGVSASTARRLLGTRKDAGKKHGHLTMFPEAVSALRRPLARLVDISLPPGEHLPALQKAQDLARRLAAILPDALTDAERLEK